MTKGDKLKRMVIYLPKNLAILPRDRLIQNSDKGKKATHKILAAANGRYSIIVGYTQF